MAKKKKQRNEESDNSNISTIVTGIAFMLLAFLGTGPYGLIGEIIKKFAVFMFGSWWILFLGFCLVIGLYMVAKRENAKYFTPRLIGIYAIIITILVFSHVSYIKVNQLEVKNILSSSFDNIKLAFGNEALISNTGGGIIGSLISIALVYFFAVEGTYIFAGLILLFGVIMLFNITLADLFDGIINFSKLVHSQKQPCPIYVNVLGNSTFVNFEQPENIPFPNKF
jgi:S-DNA-T family DNA segregation ATPase FtsK/SpoIIIE